MLMRTAWTVTIAVLFSATAQAQGDCRPSKISCSDAKRQNLSYCASQRRVETDMSYEGCIASGERALQDCLQSGNWVTGRRNLCGLTRR